MKAAKLRKTNKKEEIKEVEESYSIKKMLVIIFILVLVFGIFYFITTLVVKPAIQKTNKESSVTEIDTTMITLSHLFDRKESSYYVLVTKESSYPKKANYMDIYNSYINDYASSTDSLKFYKVDLDDALNKNYVGETNITDDINSLKLNTDALFKITDGKIAESYVGNTEITKALSNL